MNTTAPIDIDRLIQLHHDAAFDGPVFAVDPDGNELATMLVEMDPIYGQAIADADVEWIREDRCGSYTRGEMDSKLRCLAEAATQLPALCEEIRRLRSRACILEHQVREATGCEIDEEGVAY